MNACTDTVQVPASDERALPRADEKEAIESADELHLGSSRQRGFDEAVRALESRRPATLLDGRRLTTHALRHAFASHLVMRGASLKAVQDLLCHESIEMTLRSSRLAPDVKREGVRLLDRARKLGDLRETAEPAIGSPRSKPGVRWSGKRDLERYGQ